MKNVKFKNIKALTFASIMTAISIVLILVTYFLGDIGLFLIFMLPLCSSLVSVNINTKYSLIYIISTFLICSIDFQLAIFIIIPCLISGFIFGKLILIKMDGYYIIFINSLFLLGMQIISTYLINFIYQIDLVLSIANLIKINYLTFNSSYFLFLFLLSLIQSSFNYLIITNELKKFKFSFQEKKNHFIFNFITLIILIISCLLTINQSTSLSYLILGFSSYFAIILAYYNFSYYYKKSFLIIHFVLYFTSFIVFLSLLSSTNKIYYPYLFLIPITSELIVSLYIIIFQKIIKKNKINSSTFDKLK